MSKNEVGKERGAEEVSAAMKALNVDETKASGGTRDSDFEPLPAWIRSDKVKELAAGTVASPQARSPSSADAQAKVTEYDRELEKFIAAEEPQVLAKVPVAQIPTDIPQSLEAATPTAFSCHFEWRGASEDLARTNISKNTFLDSIDEVKRGIMAVDSSLDQYSQEINSHKHHKFTESFLAHQNKGVENTKQQLKEIMVKFDEIIQEVQGFGDDDFNIKEELAGAYFHTIPWIKRVRRITYEAHVFYKLNYVLDTRKAAKPFTPPAPIAEEEAE